MSLTISQAIAQLSHDDSKVRLAAVRVLAQTDPPPMEAAGPLIRLLQRPLDDSVRSWLEEALERISAPPLNQFETCVDLLQQYLGDAQWPDAAYWAATMLGRLGSEAAAAVPTLAQLLDGSEHDAVRFKAAWALGKIGPAARDSAPQLAKVAATRSDRRLASAARQALEQIIR